MDMESTMHLAGAVTTYKVIIKYMYCCNSLRSFVQNAAPC